MPSGVQQGHMDRQQFIAVALAVLMVGSMVAYTGAMLF
jgi:surface glycoprotein (TIGR04207 family)